MLLQTTITCFKSYYNLTPSKVLFVGSFLSTYKFTSLTSSRSNTKKPLYFSRSMLTTRNVANGVNLTIIRATKHVSLGGPINSNRITINNSLGLHNRTYPGEFKIYRWNNNLTPDEKRRLGLTQHEDTHYNIKETKTNRVIMLGTSAKQVKHPEVETYKISTEKINGSYISVLNPITKQPLMDDYGYLVPNLEKGGQYIAVLGTPRKISQDIAHKFEEKPEFQSYLDKYESVLKEIQEKAKNQNKLPRKIGGIDDE